MKYGIYRILMFGLTAVMLTKHTTTASTELSRCCSDGRRAFRAQGSCSSISSSVNVLFGSGLNRRTCTRSASICCIRALLETKCKAGKDVAMNGGSCSANSSPVHMECCECCLLAKELTREGKPCEAPPIFGHLCRQTFNKCCDKIGFITYTDFDVQPKAPLAPVNRPAPAINRCNYDNPCEHNCQDRGGPMVTCFCRQGFMLNADGRSCSDIDECSEGSSTCNPDEERCINKEGSYECAQLERNRPYTCPKGYDFVNSECLDHDECNDWPKPCPAPHYCINNPGSYTCGCEGGYKLNATTSKCQDINECLLNMDSCSDSQRCVNNPGSYKCLRTLSCGTGYYLDNSEECQDIDECALGTHDCPGSYTCKNTEGSFRCISKKCPKGNTISKFTGDCIPIQCPRGMRPGTRTTCEDINECRESTDTCDVESHICQNTIGSYFCRLKPNLCGDGYKTDATGACTDVDECLIGKHTCIDGQTCINLPGTYRCQCPVGYVFADGSKQCEDENECEKFEGAVCNVNAQCRNTIGSFECSCKPGYQLNADQRSCDDIDECTTGVSNCEQRCINIPGSFQCICNPGYSVGLNGRSCQDINECELWSSSDSALCMDKCINVPGSYKCQCPGGYLLEADGRTCRDIDECSEGRCSGEDRICVNILGGFRCNRITCPPNYVRDPKLKNKCNRENALCNLGDTTCLATPLSVSHNYVALPNKLDFSKYGQAAMPLFTLRGPQFAASTANFELILKEAKDTNALGIRLATRNSFALQKGALTNSAIVAVKESLEGPQEIVLELIMRVHHTTVFAGKAKAALVIYVAQYSDFVQTIPV